MKAKNYLLAALVLCASLASIDAGALTLGALPTEVFGYTEIALGALGMTIATGIWIVTG